MKKNQLNKGQSRRVMYVENKDGYIDGANARIGWVEFSKTGKTVYYRGRSLTKAQGIRGNYLDIETQEEYWVSGIKTRGSNTHWAESVKVIIDDDALDEYNDIKNS